MGFVYPGTPSGPMKGEDMDTSSWESLPILVAAGVATAAIVGLGSWAVKRLQDLREGKSKLLRSIGMGMFSAVTVVFLPDLVEFWASAVGKHTSVFLRVLIGILFSALGAWGLSSYIAASGFGVFRVEKDDPQRWLKNIDHILTLFVIVAMLVAGIEMFRTL